MPKPVPEFALQKLKTYAEYDKEGGGFIATRQLRRDSKRPGERLGSLAGGGYLQIRLAGNNYKIHHLVWAWHEREFSKGDIDHINKNKWDNRIENLRLISRKENSRNLREKGREGFSRDTGHVGINLHTKSGLWRAKVVVDGEAVLCSYHKSKDDAIAARKIFVLSHPHLGFSA